jgi:DNA ligase-1
MYTPLPIYSKLKTGKVKIWKIRVIHDISNKNNAIIKIETGLIDGKMTIFEVIISKGKNIGRSNETTPLQQAELEAISKRQKKIDTGYTDNVSGITKCNLIKPMLAQNYKDQYSKIVFPAFWQRKLDGLRGVYQNGSIHSRGLKKYPHLEFIIEELKNTKLVLDGELYSDKLTFEEISGIVRKKKLSIDDLLMLHKIEYRVYDIIEDKNFEDRVKTLETFFKENTFKYVKLVKTNVLTNDSKVKEIHDSVVKEGYEGIMIRNKLGVYQKDTRSYNLQKYKDFDDTEFKIIGFKDGVGKEANAIIYICETLEGKKFDARPKGTILERKKLYKEGPALIGKMITIKFFGYTNDNIPRFPISNLLPRETDY